jgi:DNA-binding NtrC family response regulator
MAYPKLLLVDDEVNILRALERLLIAEDFDITVVNSPQEALHLIAREEYAIVMSDQRMPQMEGTSLLQKVKEISPASVRILLTGYADIHAATSAINDGEVYRFLSKPWQDDELLDTLKNALAEFETAKQRKDVYSHNTELEEENQTLKNWYGFRQKTV